LHKVTAELDYSGISRKAPAQLDHGATMGTRNGQALRQALREECACTPKLNQDSRTDVYLNYPENQSDYSVIGDRRARHPLDLIAPALSTTRQTIRPDKEHAVRDTHWT
jgi:hypothetical protein